MDARTALALLLLFVSPALAQDREPARGWQPPELLLDEAALVVTGQLKEVDAEAGHALLTVERELKNRVDLREVPVAFTPTRFDLGAPVRKYAHLAEGTSGVWILRDRGENDRFLLDRNPGQYMEPDRTAEAVATLYRLAVQPWSEPVNGLKARSLVVRERHDPDDAQRVRPDKRLYVAVHNVTDRPMKVRNHPGLEPWEFTVTGPASARQEILYAAARELVPPGEGLVELAPGETRYLRPSGLRVPRLETPGEYTVHASMDFEAGNVAGAWSGRINAPPVSFPHGLSLTLKIQDARSGLPGRVPLVARFQNTTGTPYSLWPPGLESAWEWVFVEVGERRSYRLEQGETEGAFRPVRMAGGQTQPFPLSLPLDDSSFQDVLAPHEVVLRRRPREALPSGRYVLVGTCNLKQHPGSRARLSWTGSISAHAGVVEVP